MSFQLFEHRDQATPGIPTASLMRAGRISLNRAAIGLLGEPPPFAELLYDAENSRIGIRARRERTLASYTVVQHPSGATWYVHSKTFFRHFGIDYETTRRYPVKLEGADLVIDLRDESVTAERSVGGGETQPKVARTRKAPTAAAKKTA